MSVQKVLFIGLVWPEPQSSAAGTRIIQLINCFTANQYEVHFACAAQKSDYSFPLRLLSVSEHAIQLNDSFFNEWIRSLQPDIVVFDRFVIEEQYAWRVHQECPEALLILDTEDLHFLRKARQKAFKQHRAFNSKDLYNEEAKREIASILRCDISLIISQKEIEILTQQFHIPNQILFYLPFLEEEINYEREKEWLYFEDRKDFAFIGNFLHEPNWNAVQLLKTKIWPRLRKILPQTKLNIYGAYPSEKVFQLHRPSDHFFIHGRADDARQTIAKHRILLAPLAFGAGTKGKLIDAMQAGTPSITTEIGAEDMNKDYSWSGAIAKDWDDFVEKAVQLYQLKNEWILARQNGKAIINNLYAKQLWQDKFIIHTQQMRSELTNFRKLNFTGEILRHHTLQSTKYLSLWIEEKNKR